RSGDAETRWGRDPVRAPAVRRGTAVRLRLRLDLQEVRAARGRAVDRAQCPPTPEVVPEQRRRAGLVRRALQRGLHVARIAGEVDAADDGVVGGRVRRVV